MNRLHLVLFALTFFSFLGFVSSQVATTSIPKIASNIFEVHDDFTIMTNYQGFSTTSIVLKTTFDQEIYLPPVCNYSSYSDFNDNFIFPIFQTCDNGSLTCLDSITSYYSSPTSGATISGKIINFQNFSEFRLALRVFSGEANMEIYLQKSNGIYSSFASKSNGGSDYYFICGAQLRENNPLWNGIFKVIVSCPEDAQFNLEIGNTALIPVSTWYWAANPQLTCPITLDPTWIPLPPSQDPLLSYNLYTSLSQSSPIDILDNLLAYQIITEQDEWVLDQEQSCVLFPQDILTSCYLNFPELVNQNLEPVIVSQVFFQEANMSCNYTLFMQARTEFDNIVSILKDSTFSNSADVVNMLNSAMAYTQSTNWLGCSEGLIETMIQQTKENYSVIQYSTDCPYDAEYDYDAWAAEPCCNTALQRTQCCINESRSFAVYVYSVSDSAVYSQCSLSSCSLNTLSNTLSNYGMVNNQGTVSTTDSSQVDDCTLSIIEGISEYEFGYDPWSYCYNNIYPLACNSSDDCVAVADGSSCVQTQCIVPCMVGSDCIGTGNCVNGACTFLGATNTSFKEIATVMVTCIQNNLDAYSWAYLMYTISSTSTSKELNNTFIHDILFVDDLCSDPEYVNKNQCLNGSWCNWASCGINDNSSYCTTENCDDFSWLSTHYCAYCQGSSCQEVSNFLKCTITDSQYQTDATLCNSQGYHYVYSSIQSSCAYSNASTMASCFPPTRCDIDNITSSNSLQCNPYCYFPESTSPTTCVASSLTTFPWDWRVSLIWNSWTHQNATHGACVVTGVTTMEDCNLSDQVVWFPGITWNDSPYNNPQYCFGACVQSLFPYSMENFVVDYEKQSAEQCALSEFCSISCTNCNDTKACSNSGACNDLAGCLFPYTAKPQTCTATMITTIECSTGSWTPLGCLVTTAIEPGMSPGVCSRKNGTWIPKAMDRDTCVSKMPALCRDLSIPADKVSFDPLATDRSTLNSIPTGYNLQNGSQCSLCHGESQSFYIWQEGQWMTGGVWVPLQWKKREILPNTWRSTVSQEKWEYYYNMARAERLKSIISSFLFCKFGEDLATVDLLACDCTNTGGPDCNQGNSVVEYETGSLSACSGVSRNMTNSGAIIIVPSTITFANYTFCTEVSQTVVPAVQFISSKIVTLSSTMIQPDPLKLAGQKRILQNSNGVVIGQWIGDGYTWNLGETVVQAAITVCIVFPDDVVFDVEKIDQLDLVYTDENFDTFVPMNLSLPLGSPMGCINLTEKDNAFFFPVGIISSWSTQTFISMWDPVELFFLYFGALCYFALFIFCGYNLYYLISSPKLKGKNKPLLPKLAMSVLVVFFGDRVLYFLLLPVGSLYLYPSLDTLLSIFPSLLFLTICSVMIIRWAEIYHYTVVKKQMVRKEGGLDKLIVAVNLAMYIAFLVLLVVFFTVNDTVKEDCTTSAAVISERTQKSPNNVVSYVYKSLFSMITITLAGLFLFYGLQILSVVKKSTAIGDDSKRHYRTLYLLSVFCTTSLIAQAIQLIVSSIVNESSLATIIIILIIEIPSAVLIIILFAPKSKFGKNSKQGAPTTSSNISKPAQGTVITTTVQ